jgi:hypothetical protein
VLAYLRKGETFADLAAGFGVGTTTAWRYAGEAESQKIANRAHAQLRSPGERAAQELADPSSCAAARGAPGSSPRPSTPWKFTPHNKDERAHCSAFLMDSG